MENSREQIAASLREAIERMKESLSILERELSILEGDVPESSDVPFDISLNVEDGVMPMAEDEIAAPEEAVEIEIEEQPVMVPEEEGVEEQPEIEIEEQPVMAPEEEYVEEQPEIEIEEQPVLTPEEEKVQESEKVEDGLFGLFDNEPDMPVFEEERIPGNINEAESAHVKPSILDVAEDKLAWRVDIPGAPVHNILSAVSLNDRVMFINKLFDGDPLRFQETVALFNSMDNFADAESYVMDHFTDWKLDSDIVYRFMMAVRRKLS